MTRFSIRFRWAIVVAWIAGVVVANSALPSYSIAFGVLLDTLFVRSLLIPSIAMLLGPLNWWPSTLAPTGATPATSQQPALRR